MAMAIKHHADMIGPDALRRENAEVCLVRSATSRYRRLRWSFQETIYNRLSREASVMAVMSAVFALHASGQCAVITTWLTGQVSVPQAAIDYSVIATIFVAEVLVYLHLNHRDRQVLDEIHRGENDLSDDEASLVIPVDCQRIFGESGGHD